MHIKIMKNQVSSEYEHELFKHIIIVAIMFAAYIVFSSFSTLIGEFITLAIIAYVAAVKDIRTVVILYVFVIFWDNLLVFSALPIPVSAGFILDIAVSFRILISGRCKVQPLELFMVFYFAFMATLIFFTESSLTGFSLCLEMLIISQIRQITLRDEYRNIIWKCIFFTVFCSIMLSSVYGIIYNANLDRYISGVHVNQLASITSTARTGVYSVIAMIYPLYYTDRKWVKYLMISILLYFVISTVSLTAVIGLLLFLCTYLILKTGLRSDAKKIISTIGIVILATLLCVIFVNKLKENAYIWGILERVSTLIENLRQGNISAATSKRTDLAGYYVNYFKERNLFRQIFGNWRFNFVNVLDNFHYQANHYQSHESYLDITMTFGIFGTILWICCFLKSILKRKNDTEFHQVLLTKLLVGYIGLTASLITNPDWFVLFFI